MLDNNTLIQLAESPNSVVVELLVLVREQQALKQCIVRDGDDFKIRDNLRPNEIGVLQDLTRG